MSNTMVPRQYEYGKDAPWPNYAAANALGLKRLITVGGTMDSAVISVEKVS